MPQYDITAPDGRKFRINAPEGATQEQVLEYAKANFDKSAPQPAAPAPTAPQPNKLLENSLRIGRGFLQSGPLGAAAQGAGAAMGTIDEAADTAGGATTDVVAKVAPPEVAAGAGTAVKLLPTLVGGLVGQGTAAPTMEKGAKALMHSALKPSAQARVGGVNSDAAKAINTLLEENVNVSAAGAAKLRESINKLSGEVAKRISESPATVDKAHAASEVYGALQKFRNQVNPGADVKAVLKSWDEFNQLVANKIPVQQAQALKQGTYKVLADKYAKTGAVENEAATQAQMAMARGLRKGIEEAVPGVGQLNAKEAALINALELSEKRAGVAGNTDVAGLAWLANNPAAATAMMADRSSAFKSWLANKLYQLRNKAPAAAGAATMGVVQGSQQER